MEQAETTINASSTGNANNTAGVRTRTRWMILAMLFAITTINYADRATISLAGPEIARDLRLDAVAMGYVFSAFGWAYVVAQVPGGWLLDRFGSKRVYAVSLFLWSLFTLLAGAVGFLAGVLGPTAHLVAGIAEGVADVVAGIRDLVGQALVTVGLAPGLLGLVVDVAHGLLGVGLDVLVTHGWNLPVARAGVRPFCHRP